MYACVNLRPPSLLVMADDVPSLLEEHGLDAFEEAFAEQQGYNSVAMLRAYCVCARLRGAFKTQLVVNTGKARSSKSIFAETCEKVARHHPADQLEAPEAFARVGAHRLGS